MLRKICASAACVALLCPLAVGCASRQLTDYVSPSPSDYSAPPVAAPKQLTASTANLEIPEEYRVKKWGLADVIDIALRNNPTTRAAWLDAKSAAAKVGVADAAFYPKVSLDASASHKYLDRDDTDITTRQTTYGPAVSLSYMLFDFGGRGAVSEGSLQTLAAASWTHNRLIQDTVLLTQKAYYLYFSTKAAREAQFKTLERAKLVLKTAEGRHEAGVATISDVLSARTALSQAQLALDTIEGAIETTRGNLAVAMGFSATQTFDIEDSPDSGRFEDITSNVEGLINEALAKRPDLLAARMQAQAAKAQFTKAESDGLPTLNLTANTGLSWIDLNNEAITPNNGDRREESYFVGVTLSVPLFTGFSTTYNIERARRDAESAGERARGLEQLAVSQVFTAYHALKTASKKVRTADDLIASATQNEEVALGRYKEGVGTILDVVTAQASLSGARTQSISARWEWKTALAQLAHDTGKLELAGPAVGR